MPVLPFLDGNSAFANVDLDVRGLLPLLVEPIAKTHGGDGEHPDDKVETVAIPGRVAPETDTNIRLANVWASGLT